MFGFVSKKSFEDLKDMHDEARNLVAAKDETITKLSNEKVRLEREIEDLKQQKKDLVGANAECSKDYTKLSERYAADMDTLVAKLGRADYTIQQLVKACNKKK